MFESLESPVYDVALAALRAAERQAAVAAVAQWDAALAVWQSTPADFRTGAQPQAYAEIGVALGLSRLGAAQRLAMGEALLSFPLLRTLLLGGRLGVVHAIAAVEELTDLGGDALGDEALGEGALAGRVLHRVLASEGRWGWQDTAGTLRAALQMTAVLLDPAGAARRRTERQATQARVRLRARGDGMADLTATGCAEQLTAADRLLDLLAVPTGPQDDRSLGQRQIDALVGALVARAGRAVPVELQLQIPVRLAVAGLVAQHDPARTVLPEPLVVVTDLGPDLLDRLPHGPVPPDTQPEPDTLAAGSAGDRLEAEVGQVDDVEEHPGQAEDTGPRGTELRDTGPRDTGPRDTGPRDTGPRDTGLRYLGTGGTGTGDLGTGDVGAGDMRSGVVDRRDDEPEPVDPAAPEPALPAPQGGRARRHRPHSGVPLLLGHGPIDPARLVELLTDPAGLPVGLAHVQVRRVLVDRTGQAVAADARAVPLHRLLTDQRGLLPALLARLPGPPPRTDAYRPTAVQTRVVRARDRCCTFPGCARRPRRTDLDHRVRHPDGPTSTANLHVLCRHHHRLKHDGWQPVRHLDGTTTWTSPRGQVLHTPRP